MSVVGVSVGGDAPRAFQPVAIYDAATGTAAGGGTAANPSVVKDASQTPLGYQQILSATLASSTAMTVPSGATTAIVQNNGTTAVRFRYDGATTAPTASTGQRLLPDAIVIMDVGNAGLTATRFIYESAGPILDITYFS